MSRLATVLLLVLLADWALAVTYIERDAIEPYATGPIKVYLQGKVLSPTGKPSTIVFETSSELPTQVDLAIAQQSSDEDFELFHLTDCFDDGVEELAFDQEECCSGRDPLCFLGLWTYERCCEHNQAGKAFLADHMAEARRMVAPLLPRYNISEERFAARRLKHRHGSYDEECHFQSAPPASKLPDSFDQPETGLRVAWEVLRDAGVVSRTALQFGVNDGKSDDPLYPLIMTQGIRGVGIEADPALANMSREHRPGNFRVVESFVTPHNAWQFAGPIGPIDMVVVDIDSFECDLVDSLLTAARGHEMRTGLKPPALVQVETNTMIPPPFRFVRKHSKNQAIARKQLATTSCSLSYMVELFGELGYELLFYGYDSLFVRRDLAPLYTEAWGHRFPKDEFLCYRRSFVHSVTTPMSVIRRWFFNTDDPTDLWKTHGEILANLRRMNKEDGFDMDSAHFFASRHLNVSDFVTEMR